MLLYTCESQRLTKNNANHQHIPSCSTVFSKSFYVIFIKTWDYSAKTQCQMFQILNDPKHNGLSVNTVENEESLVVL